jgi:hypothetical protein
LPETASSPASILRPEEHGVLTVGHDSAHGEVAICLDSYGLRMLHRAPEVPQCRTRCDP